MSRGSNFFRAAAATAIPVAGVSMIPGVNEFISRYAEDRVGDVKSSLGIRDPDNLRDPYIRMQRAGSEGNKEELEASLKEIDPNRLSPIEQAEYRKYQKQSEEQQKGKVLSERDDEFRRLYGDKGLVTQLEDRKSARDVAMAREALAGQKDIVNIQGRNQFNIQGLANQGAVDQANLSGLWGFRQADRGALASETNTKVQTAANLVGSFANTEAQREGQLLQAKGQRAQGLLNSINANKSVGANLIAAVSGRRSF
jgi:hypothetical protein